MALARRRDWYFAPSIVRTLVFGVLTLGLGPLARTARTFDRFRRLEWIQYAELARWLSDRTRDPIAGELVSFAEGAGRPARRPVVAFAIATIVVCLAAVGLRTHSVIVPIQFVHAPITLAKSNLAYLGIGFAMLFAIAWCSVFLNVIRQIRLTNVWIERCNQLLAAREQRPIVAPPSTAITAPILLALVLGLAGIAWAACAVVVIAIANRYIIATRAVRLAMIERMLELMDQSGLPVEFDVEELEPEAIAAALG